MGPSESPAKRRRANTNRTELRNRIALVLNKFLKRRPQAEELRERNILQDCVTVAQKQIERSRAASRLATFLSHKTGAKKKYPQFGYTPSALAAHHRDQPQGIPRVVWICINFLDNELRTEGLFRVPGSFREITQLRIAVEAGCVDILSGCPCAHTVAGLVSSFFRDLPEPLIVYSLFENFLEVVPLSERDKAPTLRRLISQLPTANTKLLRAFLALLYRIQLNSAQNKMTAGNLGLVWGPTLLRPRDETKLLFDGSLAASCNVIAYMIENHTRIFPPAITPPPRPILQSPASSDNIYSSRTSPPYIPPLPPRTSPPDIPPCALPLCIPPPSSPPNILARTITRRRSTTLP